MIDCLMSCVSAVPKYNFAFDSSWTFAQGNSWDFITKCEDGTKPREYTTTTSDETQSPPQQMGSDMEVEREID